MSTSTRTLTGLTGMVCRGGEVRQVREPLQSAWLPYGPFVREWTLMRDRARRVSAELGDVSAQRTVEATPIGYLCNDFLDIVGVDRLTRTATAPLAEVLADPVPF